MEQTSGEKDWSRILQWAKLLNAELQTHATQFISIHYSHKMIVVFFYEFK
jgi:hypothetical protein